jgi:hypothetical protein
LGQDRVCDVAALTDQPPADWSTLNVSSWRARTLTRAA